MESVSKSARQSPIPSNSGYFEVLFPSNSNHVLSDLSVRRIDKEFPECYRYIKHNYSNSHKIHLELNNEEQAKIDLGANALALPTNWTITSWFTTPFNVDTVLAVHALASGSNDAHVAFDSWGEQNLGVFDNTFKFVDFGATEICNGT